MPVMIGFIAEEDADGDVRVFGSEYLFPESEKLVGELLADGGFVAVSNQWSKPPLIPPWIIKGEEFASRHHWSEMCPWSGFFECRGGCQYRLFIAGFADDVEPDRHPVGVEAARDAGGGEADGVDGMGVR